MVANWTYSAIILEPGGDIREISFSSREELEGYIRTCDKQVLFTRTKIGDNSANKELNYL